jgi:hypothetical protein
VSGFAPHAVGAHHLDQHALAQAAIGDAQSFARKKSPNGVEDGATGQHQIGAFGADAGIGARWSKLIAMSSATTPDI